MVPVADTRGPACHRGLRPSIAQSTTAAARPPERRYEMRWHLPVFAVFPAMFALGATPPARAETYPVCLDGEFDSGTLHCDFSNPRAMQGHGVSHRRIPRPEPGIPTRSTGDPQRPREAASLGGCPRGGRRLTAFANCPVL